MKKGILWFILGLIFLIVFNVIFFLFGAKEHPVSVWISYAFIHFSYIMMVMSPILVRRSNNTAVLGFPIVTISGVYFLIELVVGIAFIAMASEKFKIPLIVQLIIAAAFLIVLIANLLANEYTADAQEKRQPQIDYIKKGTAELSGILNSVGTAGFSKETEKAVEKAYDAIRTSPVKSHPDVQTAEMRILLAIDDLKTSLEAGNEETVLSAAKQLTTMIDERNRQLKTK